jgi:CRISPR/Cas system-associated exonuclease Cas4 (RecB family)
MKSFLLELAEKISGTKLPLSMHTLVFPNRRAALYFRKHLSSLLRKPSFAPRLITIEDFIGQFSSFIVPDKLALIHRLHKTYQDVVKTEESFDQFYFWGEMLLRDFEEVDKYMINATQLFKDLSQQKEIDSSFDFLTPEQLEFLKTFWDHFDENPSNNKKRFLHVWRQLPEVYSLFRDNLSADNYAYEGMLHRYVAEGLKNGNIKPDYAEVKLHFAGFNALTKTEEEIISFFVREYNAEVHWDHDAYYVNNNTQEAGMFFREYQEHPVLGKTFSSDIPSNFKAKKTVEVLGAAQNVGQAKLMSQVLQDHLLKGMIPEETLIVLPDEKLMLPVLHGISASVETLNVTMGFPLSSTPLFNLIELLIELQINKRIDEFNHRQILAIIGHPYVVSADAKSSNEKRKDINKHNRVYVPASWLQTDCVLHQLIFRPLHASGNLTITQYLREIVMHIGALENIADFDKEYCFHFVKFINRIEEILDQRFFTIPTDGISQTVERDIFKSFLRLFRQLVRAQKIPFTGEPLKGLQVMGVLETRNLDFKNVFMLSLNEGALPSGSGKGSYIPHNIRKAYSMPTQQHQDSMYAYLFYRVMQRAENVFLFYNSETDVLGQGEMSRYLQQLLYESGWEIKKKVLHNPVQPNAISIVEVKKDEEVMRKLKMFLKGHPAGRGFYPTNLIDYLECRLRFYLRHVAGIREAAEVEEDLDARVLGSFVHKVMQYFYEGIQTKDGLIEIKNIDEQIKKIPQLIDRVFIETYRLDPEKPVSYDGQRLVVREVVIQFVDRILEKDKAYAPFHLEGIERGGLSYAVPVSISNRKAGVLLKGIIDRIDRKENEVRVIDYKTGKDKVEIKGGLSSLFTQTGELNKAAFQTLYYALLYKTNYPYQRDSINAGLFNRNTLFGDEEFGLKLNYERLKNVNSLLPEFEDGLTHLLEELFNPEIPFNQTTDLDHCKNCPYQTICYR